MLTLDTGYTLSESIQIWGTVISAVVMIATIAQVIVAYLIARSIKSASDRSEMVHTSRHINQMWQDYNRLVIIDPEFRKVAMRLDTSVTSEEEFQLRYLIFIILNVLHDAFHAKKISGTSTEHIDANYNELVRTLLPEKETAISILKGKRGFDTEFEDFCLNILEKKTSQ